MNIVNLIFVISLAIGVLLVVVGIVTSLLGKRSTTGVIKIDGFKFETSNAGLVMVVLGCVMMFFPLFVMMIVPRLTSIAGPSTTGIPSIVCNSPAVPGDAGLRVETVDVAIAEARRPPEPKPVPAMPATPGDESSRTDKADAQKAAAPHSVAKRAPASPAAQADTVGSLGHVRLTRLGPNVTRDGVVVFNFKPVDPGRGKRIYLSGNFNGWSSSDPAYLLSDGDGDGIWSVTIRLRPGSYQYKFYIDGQWIKDPYSPSDAPDGYGGRNSEFRVPLAISSEPASPKGTQGAIAPSRPGPAPELQAPRVPLSPMWLGPNATPYGVVFNFRPPAQSRGKKIYLAGNFNGWSPADPSYLLSDDDGDGIWSITVRLRPGSYQYKFYIDGQWIKDPYSPSDAPDGYGGRNGKFDVAP